MNSLARQDFPETRWELLIVDNASTSPITTAQLEWKHESALRVLSEPQPGLTPARLRGISEADGDLLIFVDDDNVLSEGYLSIAHQTFQENPNLGAAGGPVQPEFDYTPQHL